MNQKAESLQAYFAEKKLNFFQVQEMNDELKTVLFRSNIEIQKQTLPTVIVTDDTIWTIIRTQIVAGAVTADKRAAVNEFLNGLNMKYKLFKYYVTDGGDINIDICAPSIPATFDPEMIRSLIQIEVEQLEEIYPQIMEVVWAK